MLSEGKDGVRLFRFLKRGAARCRGAGLMACLTAAVCRPPEVAPLRP